MPSWNDRGVGLADAQALFTRRPGVLGESFPIGDCTGVLTPSTGMLYLTSVLVEKGQTVTNIGFKTGTTAASTPTNWWYGIWTHDTAGSPVIPASDVISMSRTSGNPTLTVVSGTLPISLVGRLVTGSGMPASGRVISQTTTTVTMSGNATSGSPTNGNVTFGQYAGPRQNIAVTADSTNTVTPAVDTFYPKALSPNAWLCPGTGLYFFGWMLATGATQCNIVGKNSPAGMGVTTWNHLAHSNAAGHTTPPGANNPLSSVTDVVNWPYAYFT